MRAFLPMLLAPTILAVFGAASEHQLLCTDAETAALHHGSCIRRENIGTGQHDVDTLSVLQGAVRVKSMGQRDEEVERPASKDGRSGLWWFDLHSSTPSFDIPSITFDEKPKEADAESTSSNYFENRGHPLTANEFVERSARGPYDGLHVEEDDGNRGESKYEEQAAPEASPVDVAVGGSLMAMLVFVLALLYTTSSADPDIRKVANFAICNTISIFLAMLTYRCAMSLTQAEHPLRSKAAELSIKFGIFFLLLTVVCLALRFVEDRPTLVATRIFGSHFVGFAAAEAFGSIQTTEPFASNVFLAFCVVIFARVIFFKLQVFILPFMLCQRDVAAPVREEFEDD
jgi:hypothetical protein